MIEWFSHKVLNWMIRVGSISEKDSELYLFGVHQCISSIINIITTLVIAAVLHAIPEGIMFAVTYLPLRSYAGGYHARTELRCYILSSLLTVIVCLASKQLPVNFFTILLMCGTILIIWICSPIEDSNKPLDSQEIKVYGSRTKKIIVLEMFVLILLYVFHIDCLVQTMFISYYVLCIILLLGALRNHCIRHNFEGN